MLAEIQNLSKIYHQVNANKMKEVTGFIIALR